MKLRFDVPFKIAHLRGAGLWTPTMRRFIFVVNGKSTEVYLVDAREAAISSNRVCGRVPVEESSHRGEDFRPKRAIFLMSPWRLSPSSLAAWT